MHPTPNLIALSKEHHQRYLQVVEGMPGVQFAAVITKSKRVAVKYEKAPKEWSLLQECNRFNKQYQHFARWLRLQQVFNLKSADLLVLSESNVDQLAANEQFSTSMEKLCEEKRQRKLSAMSTESRHQLE